MLHGDWLASFVEFAEHLSFTHAAARRHITQPALHAQIRKLSEAIGAPLYRRDGRSLLLTEAGISLLAFARESAEREASLLAGLRGESPTTAVTLAAGEGALLYLLGDALHHFAARKLAPLRVLTRNREEVLAALRSGAAHLGVTTLDAPQPGVMSALLSEVPQVLVLPRRHALAGKPSLRLRDLDHERLILAPTDAPHRRSLMRALTHAGLTTEPMVEASGWPLMLHLASLGLGLAIVNGICPPPRGTVLRPLLDLPRIRYLLVWREGARLPPSAQALHTALLATRSTTPTATHAKKHK